MLSEKKTIYIIDAHGFLHRNYHALPKLSTSQGVEIGALYGFSRWITRFINEKKPDYVAVCFDSRGGSTKRKEMFSDYKAQRKKPDEALINQLHMAREFVEGMGLAIYAAPGFEADDIMALIAHKSVQAGAKVVLVTSDKDAYQLLSDDIKLWPSGSAKEDLRGAEFVKEKFGVEQPYLIDYLSIVGDSSDNVPGIAGIGPKTAIDLINTFGHLEDVIKAAQSGDSKIKPATAKRVLEYKADALMSKELVKLDEDIPIDFNLPASEIHIPPADKLEELFSKYEFKVPPFLKEKEQPKIQQESMLNDGMLFSITTTKYSVEDIKNKITDRVFMQAEEPFLLLGTDEKTFLIKNTEEVTEDERKIIVDIIKDNKILKLSYDLKFTLRIFDFTPDFFINAFDLRLAAHTLNPGRNLSFTELCKTYLDTELKPETEKEFLLTQNNFAYRLMDKLEIKLMESNQQKVYKELEIPLTSVLLFMEQQGIEVDLDWLRKFGANLESEINVLQSEIETMAGGDININSPKQLGVLLFERLRLPSVKKTKTGYSTDEEVLQQLVNLHPVVKKILEYRSNNKLKSTYVDNLLLMADDNSRVHTYLDQTGTVTGRLSSSSPNLQNIPIRTEKGRMLRRAFIAGQGNVLLSLDYSQIDLRLLAHESGDEVLINAFKEGGDIHTKTAAEIFGVMREMVSPEMRTSAKAINFGIIYGQGPMALSQTLNISMREAKEFIDNYFASYKGVRTWIDENIKLARERGYVKTLAGHVRFLPEFQLGSAQMSSFAQRAAINTIIQGGSSDVIKEAMNHIFKEFADSDVKLLLQIHDDLIFELPKEKLQQTAVRIKYLMENAVELKVPLLVEAKAGVNWYEMQRLEL
ncbi:DNA polymerase-1 [Elusimicrobium posterum]|uniref:DNA polymerase I n=1 Tax=Elusimicrobium posterum TaxID=3116653 RepID=UPI003C73B23A